MLPSIGCNEEKETSRVTYHLLPYLRVLGSHIRDICYERADSVRNMEPFSSSSTERS